jgi:hypothetical protein
MALFFLLPPRAHLADHLANALHDWLPGHTLTVADRQRLCACVCEALAGDEVYLIHREDLPAGERAEPALVDGYGAAPGDEIVEVRPAARAGEFHSRRWRIGEFGRFSD